MPNVVLDKADTMGLFRSSCWTHPAPIQAATPSSAIAFPAAAALLEFAKICGSFHKVPDVSMIGGKIVESAAFLSYVVLRRFRNLYEGLQWSCCGWLC